MGEETVMELIRFRRRNLTEPDPDPKMEDGHEPEHHLSADDMKHRFALQPLNDSAFGSAREFLCHCIRCKWTFQVNPDRGSIVAFNNVGEPLEGAEATRRIATFAEGPCPAFADFSEYADAREAHRPPRLLDRLHPVLHLLGLDSSTE
jgi:hypothetical protein